MISEQEFKKGRQHVPFPLRSDAYSISSNCFASEQAKEKSVYNFVNRYSPTTAFPSVANDSRMVLYGLSQFIRNHLTHPITKEDVIESAAFMKEAHSFGGSLNFDADLWMRVVNEYGGYLPIRIEALPEGSTFFPNEPVIQVTSLDSGFGELAAHIEALMVGMVSTATAKVTLLRHWLDRLREWVAADNPPDVGQEQIDAAARVMIHDFGMRASSCSEESELLGLAHLLVFHGTDTFNSAFLARKMNANLSTGGSIIALAHRNVQSYDTEKEAFESIYNASHDSASSVASYVSDCYNYQKAIEEILLPLAKSDPNSIFIARPDSGPYIQNVLDLAELADENGLSYQREDGYYGPQNLRFINGDSMNPTKVEEIMKALKYEGFVPTEWGIYGVGGYGRNEATRDALSSAFKLASCGYDNRPVVKLSESRGKLSVPGPNRVIRNRDKGHLTVFLESEVSNRGEYETYYEPEVFHYACRESFSTLQQRTIRDFDSWSEVAKNRPNMGLWEDTILSTMIKGIQQEFYERYR